MERPIIFNTEMVKAILEGRKTQTMRIMKLQPPEFATLKMFGEKPACFYCCDGYQTEIKAPCQVGDILWVRETWQNICAVPLQFAYKADGEFEPYSPWKPSIHMPRAAARIFLEIKNVRVERLQDITEEDAVKEGVKAYGPNNCSGTSARIAFAQLWDEIYDNWHANPWVWVIEFERLEG